MSFSNLFVVQLLNGVALGLLYVLVASGLSVIFGVSGILNFAHGSLYMLGAYLGVVVMGATGNFWLALLLAPLLVGAASGVIERLTLHHLYDRPVAYQLLLTFGLSLMIIEGTGAVFGSQRAFPTPEALAGPIQFGGIFYPKYRLFVIGASILVSIGIWAFFRYTDFGLVVRAGSQNREMVKSLGIDVSRYFTLVFVLGSVLAAVAGVLAAPLFAVNTNMGNEILLVSFIVVILGGLGSFRGSVIAGLLIGVTTTLGETYVPQLTGFYIYGILLGTLLLRPQGLFGQYDLAKVASKASKISYQRRIDPVPIRDRRALAAVAVMALIPIIAVGVGSAYYVGVLSIMLVWGLIALSLDLALGRLGLLSFGHAAFFGLGAYATGLLFLNATNSLLVALLVAVPLTVAVAWLVGAVSIRFAGVFFAMVTLAITQLFYQLSVTWTDLTGGSDGLTALPSPTLLGVTVDSTVVFYYITLASVVVTYGLVVRMLDSPFGRVIEAIREGERRTSFLGYDTSVYKRRTLALSGGVAGVAGVLYAGSQSVVTPNVLHWTISGDALFSVILGGMGTLFGPLIGGGIYAGMQLLLSSYIDSWRFVLGLLLVLTVMFAPRGLVSVYSKLAGFVGPRFGRPDGSAGEGGPSVPEASANASEENR
ncbi:ABC transporter permease subunit [Halobellus sp. GM3]|uniref:ABC transporter permease subunit n=1 Tax=Halobellus sp. GM3 TaxID=3458410 RepID=UPI00403DB687